MLRNLTLLLITATLIAACPATAHEGHDHEATAKAPGAKVVRVLLMTGEHNHDWKATNPILEKLIDSTDRLQVTTEREPWDLGPEAFADFDVVFSNWGHWPNTDSDPWGAETKAAFLEFISNGGGLVVMHGGGSLHYPWPEFQAMVGLAWTRGKTTHGPRHNFKVYMKGDHPITAGMKTFEIYDELWRFMVPTGDHEVLALADVAGDKKGPGPDEPMLITTKLGKGRGVNVVLGHDTQSLQNPALQELLLRSMEWAATGKVRATYGLVEAQAASPELTPAE